VFLVAGGLKVIDPQAAVAAVRAYRLLPASVAPILGWGLPFAEIALGLLLLAGAATRVADVSAVAVTWRLGKPRTASRSFVISVYCCWRCGWCGNRGAGSHLIIWQLGT
jgi:hypothetical protein